jgi:hypothetical protein
MAEWGLVQDMTGKGEPLHARLDPDEVVRQPLFEGLFSTKEADLAICQSVLGATAG